MEEIVARLERVAETLEKQSPIYVVVERDSYEGFIKTVTCHNTPQKALRAVEEISDWSSMAAADLEKLSCESMLSESSSSRLIDVYKCALSK